MNLDPAPLLRQLDGMTTAAAADLLCTSPQNVRRWRQGERLLQPGMAAKLAAALSIDPEDLWPGSALSTPTEPARYVPTAMVGPTACRGLDPDVFFPGQGEPAGPAKAICRVCTSRAECLTGALERGEALGIWGETSARQRWVLHRRIAKGESIADVVASVVETQGDLEAAG